MVDTDSLIIDSPLGKSDHAVIHFDYLCSCNTSIDDTEKFQFFKGKYNLMSDELSDIDWDTLFENKNVEEEMWNIFKSKLHNSMENHIPKRRHDNRFTNPPLWMDKNAKLAIINKRRAWRKYKYSRTRASYIDYALNRNSCTNIIRNSKLPYESKVALESKTNNKFFWKYVNSRLK
jgi:hypothetical protein